jgi:hypothetical protein
MKTKDVATLPPNKKISSRDFIEEERLKGAANSCPHPATAKRNLDGVNRGNLHSPKWLPLWCGYSTAL